MSSDVSTTFTVCWNILGAVDMPEGRRQKWKSLLPSKKAVFEKAQNADLLSNTVNQVQSLGSRLFSVEGSYLEVISLSPL